MVYMEVCDSDSYNEGKNILKIIWFLIKRMTKLLIQSEKQKFVKFLWEWCVISVAQTGAI